MQLKKNIQTFLFTDNSIEEMLSEWNIHLCDFQKLKKVYENEI